MTLRRVFTVLLFLQVWNVGLRETLDPDMWWHLRTGAYIVDHGVPRHDVFSFTVPGHAWVTHEWLAEVVMWLVYQVGGLPGLSAVFAALAALAFWFAYGACAGRPYLAALVVLMAALAAGPSIGVRPQVFSLLMAAAFVCIVEGVRDLRLPTAALFALPAAMALWANLHGGYLLGIALLGGYAAGDSLDLLSGRSADPVRVKANARLLVVLAVACLGAAAVNPNGWHLWKYPFGTLGSAFMQENIAEWLSPDFHSHVYWPFAAMLGLGAVCWAAGARRPCASDVVLFMGTGMLGLVSRRHIAVFAVVATPILARAVAAAVSGRRAAALLTVANSAAAPAGRKARWNAVILVVGVLLTGVWAAAKLRKNEAAVARVFPVHAVDFLEREGLAGQPGYNTYGWGGYLIWRGIRVFVDGRADVYGDEFLSRYLEAFRLKEEWRQPLDEYNVVYVLVERSNPLGTLLEASGQWQQTYADDVAWVFVRRGANGGQRETTG